MLSADRLREVLGPRWTRVEVVAETGSTNADLLADTAAPDGSVLIAECQTAGRGRLNRTWAAPPGASLTFSVSVRPTTAVSGWGWLPLLTGVALQEAVVAASGVDAGLKWPNDLLAADGSGKLAGILAQAGGDMVVVGIGLNVSSRRDELPVDSATSLALCGAGEIEHAVLLAAILDRLDAWLSRWASADGDAEACGLAAAYRSACLTLGRSVSVTATTGQVLTGTATGIDATGRLLVDTDAGTSAVGAGDVQHVRPVAPRGPG